MNCYYHPTTVAIGTCKSCSKGLCTHCAVDLSKGLACKGRCEKDVAAVIGLIDRNIQMSPESERLIKAARSNRYVSPIILISFGSLFLGIAAYQAFTAGFQSSDLILWGMGSFFIFFGLYTLYRAISLSRSN